MSSTAVMKSPYKGLVPYSDEDAEFFFGRERERNFITANLLAERLTLLYGASGVGKSSVLRAGVQHHIKLLAQQNLERLGKPKYVVVVFNDWRDVDPLRSLLVKVEDAVNRTLKEKIEPVDSSLSFTDALLEWSKRIRGHLLIILDQFEEYFLYHEGIDGPGTFAEEFPKAVKNLGLPANFLISFREDAFSKLAFFKVRMPDVFGNYLPIEHLDHSAGQDAILKPIEQYNKRLTNGDGRVSVEPALVDEVLKQVETGQVILGETGRGTLKKETSGTLIETPFLQMVMVRLWNEERKTGSHVLKLATLEKLADKQTGESGAKRIVRTHVDETMDALSAEKQDIAADVFHYLVTPSGTKIAHTVADLAKYAELPKKQLAATLEELATGDKRILRGVARSADSEARYEIFHDVLATPLLDWRSRRVAARRAEEERKEIEKLARENEKARSANRLRGLAVVLALMVVTAVVFAVSAFSQRSKATTAAAAAERARAQEEEKSRQLQELNVELEAARGLAIKKSEEATDQRVKAEENEKSAKNEAARAVKNLQTAKDQLKGDLEAANKNYRDVDGFDNACDKRGALEENRKEYETLLKRYTALGAEAEKAKVRRQLSAINKRMDGLECMEFRSP